MLSKSFSPLGPSLDSKLSGHGLVLGSERKSIFVTGGYLEGLGNGYNQEVFHLNCVADLQICQWTKLPYHFNIGRANFALFLTVFSANPNNFPHCNSTKNALRQLTNKVEL